MPDSQQPPFWGPAYHEWDLDALLSGAAGNTPPALRPVESTLAALRAAATRRELSDEAAARAAYRSFARAPLTPASPPRTAASAEQRADVPAHTLVLSSADHQEAPAARHRHRHRRSRRAAGGARRPGIAVTGAAAALIVVAVVAGALTGSIGRLTSFGRQPVSASASARATGQSPGSQGLLATGAARDRTPNPKPTAPAPPAPRPTSDPGSQCREYFAYFEHPTRAGGADWSTLRDQLARQAGSPLKIYAYCLHYLDNPLGGRGVWPPPGTDVGGFGAGGGSKPGTGGLGAGGQESQGGPAAEQGQSGHPAAVAGRP